MIEILCTITGIVAGVAIVASLMQGRASRNQFVRPTTADGTAPPVTQIHGIADQLRLLSFRVAADVSAHSEKVEAINGRLNGGEPDQPQEILSAINDLIAANQTMQGQLADARKRIAHQSEMIEEATQQARTDALTGLANRRALNEFLQNCLNAIRPGECAGLLLLDIDHFKSFNDNYGHTTGDAVLAAFARNIRKWCNQECYPARYGGEEFAVILTGRDAQSIAQKCADLRKFVSEQTISFEDLQLNITASAGMCLLAGGDTLQSAYDRSDEGLYNAKKAGRNCGFWLQDADWQPFPDAVTDTGSSAPKSTARNAQELIRQSSTSGASRNSTDAEEDSTIERTDVAEARSEVRDREPEDSPVRQPNEERLPNADYGDVLDLETFTSRITVYIEQLRKAELPATGTLIQVIGLEDQPESVRKTSWLTIQSLIQSQLRGIDLMCHYSEMSGCLFLPGCSTEVAAERAGRLQALLEDAKLTWPDDLPQPERLAIAIASARNEAAESFLKRLETTLQTAMPTGKFELAIHDGQRAVVEGAVQA